MMVRFPDTDVWAFPELVEPLADLVQPVATEWALDIHYWLHENAVVASLLDDGGNAIVSVVTSTEDQFRIWPFVVEEGFRYQPIEDPHTIKSQGFQAALEALRTEVRRYIERR